MDRLSIEENWVNIQDNSFSNIRVTNNWREWNALYDDDPRWLSSVDSNSQYSMTTSYEECEFPWKFVNDHFRSQNEWLKRSLDVFCCVRSQRLSRMFHLLTSYSVIQISIRRSYSVVYRFTEYYTVIRGMFYNVSRFAWTLSLRRAPVNPPSTFDYNKSLINRK